MQAGPATRSTMALLDDYVDAQNQAIKLYLKRLDQTGLDADDAARSVEIMGYAINLEHVGDAVEVGPAASLPKRPRDNIHFATNVLPSPYTREAKYDTAIKNPRFPGGLNW